MGSMAEMDSYVEQYINTRREILARIAGLSNETGGRPDSSRVEIFLAAASGTPLLADVSRYLSSIYQLAVGRSGFSQDFNSLRLINTAKTIVGTEIPYPPSPKPATKPSVLESLEPTPNEIELLEIAVGIEALTSIFIEVTDRNKPSPQYDISSVRQLVLDADQKRHKDWGEVLLPWEATLSEDPSGTYSRCDLLSKRAYRARVHVIALRAGSTATAVAEAALGLSRRDTEDQLGSNIGYYLFDSGLTTLWDALPSRSKTESAVEPVSFLSKYFLTVFGVCDFALMLILSSVRAHSFWMIHLNPLVILAVFALSIDLALQLSHSFHSGETYPPLLRIDRRFLTERVVIAIPVVIFSQQQIQVIISSISSSIVRNTYKNVAVVLLTDFADTKARGDSETERHILLTLQKEAARVATALSVTVCVCHRERVYDAAEGAWMGLHRKPGKMKLLNDLLILNENGFSEVSGPMETLVGSRFVVILDEDCELAEHAIERMLGTIQHPLNEAYLEQSSGRNFVSRGLGIVQPNLSVSRKSYSKWRAPFCLIAGFYDGEPTQSLGTLRLSIFGRDGYYGKAMYDARVANAVIDQPRGTAALLSHDTIDNLRAPTGPLSDAAIVENYPSSWGSVIGRFHRWCRGDVQNIPSILHFMRHNNSRSDRRYALYILLGHIGKLLFSVGILGYLTMGDNFEAGCTFREAGALLCALLLPAYISFFCNVWRASRRQLAWADIKNTGRLLGMFQIQILYMLILVPLIAVVQVHAVLTASIRLIKGTRLLEWKSMTAVEMGRARLPILWRTALCIGLTAICLAFLLMANMFHNALIVVLPLWLASIAVVTFQAKGSA
jgi:cyclic beta-1,2-glucan synthetase